MNTPGSASEGQLKTHLPGDAQKTGEEISTMFQSNNLDYIHTLLKSDNVSNRIKQRLYALEYLCTDPEHGYDGNIDLSQRYVIKDNMIYLDDDILSIENVSQDYWAMKENPEKYTYKDYAKRVLNWSAKFTDTTFSFPSTREKLQEGEIDGEEFMKEINTPENRRIIEVLRTVWGLNGLLPVGIDNAGNIIVLNLIGGHCRFYCTSNADFDQTIAPIIQG